MTQALLKKALKKLEEVYSSPPAENATAEAAPASFLQLAHRQPAMPTYERSSSGGGVLDLMNGIITDSAMLESEATAAEQDKAEKEAARLSAISSKKGSE